MSCPIRIKKEGEERGWKQVGISHLFEKLSFDKDATVVRIAKLSINLDIVNIFVDRNTEKSDSTILGS